MNFSSLGLSAPILKAVTGQGYDSPSPIQAKAIPAIIAGKDVMAAAQTGTGKTAGFTLPILERLASGKPAKSKQIRVLILTPTRELAAQVNNSVVAYSKHLPLHSAVVFGGVKINPQISKLRQGVDILVATPGRLLDLYSQNAVSFEKVEVLVLDEADRMLDMGFIHDIRKILKTLPAKRQNLMFSATFSKEIRKLANGLVNNPVEISVSPPNTAVKTVTHWICPTDKSRKSALLVHMIREFQWRQVLVFSRTKHGANRLAKILLKHDIKSAAIHGNKSQGARTKALADFKKGSVQVLVATDIAARGLDINELPQVVNFDLPSVPEDYVHRIGRTGRAGKTGEAISLVSADEAKQLNDIERLLKHKLNRKFIDGFEPEHSLPESKPGQKQSQGKGQGQGQNQAQAKKKSSKTKSGSGYKPKRPQNSSGRNNARKRSRNRAAA